MRSALCLAATLALSPIAVQGTTLFDLCNGGSLVDGSYEASNWTCNDVSTVLVDYSQIEVEMMSLLGDPGVSIWYDFDNQFVVDNNDFIDLDLIYDLTTATGLPFIRNSVELTDPEFLPVDAGFIVVEEDVFCGGILATQTRAEIDPAFGISHPDDEADFFCMDTLTIEKRIQVESTGGLVQLGDLHQQFDRVPVPATAALFALGLIGLRLSRRRKR